MARVRCSNSTKNSVATLGVEVTLWAAADKLRNNIDAAEYKHVILSLIFPKPFGEKNTLLREYVHWKYGVMPVGNAIFPWALNDKKFMGALE